MPVIENARADIEAARVAAEAEWDAAVVQLREGIDQTMTDINTAVDDLTRQLSGDAVVLAKETESQSSTSYVGAIGVSGVVLAAAFCYMNRKSKTEDDYYRV